MGEQLPFNVKITNSGAFTAKGCHVRSDQYWLADTDWRSTSPARPEHQAVDIAPKGSATLNVKVTSIWSRGADPGSLGDIIIECANTRELTLDLSNRFDVTAWGLGTPAEALATKVAPPLDTLNVPAGGQAVFRVKAVNSGPPATLVARPRYQRPFDDTAPNRRFLVSVCLDGKRQLRSPRPPGEQRLVQPAPERHEPFPGHRPSAGGQPRLQPGAAACVPGLRAGDISGLTGSAGRNGECRGQAKLVGWLFQGA